MRLMMMSDEMTNGSIFEFAELEQARAFAAAVKERWGLDCRIFQDAEEAARAHMFPWEQKAPVVHLDRPTWALDRNSSKEERERAIN
jgi:hypothetical protein